MKIYIIWNQVIDENTLSENEASKSSEVVS